MSQSDTLKHLVIDVLEEMKAQDVSVLDVQHLTSICDTMVVCTGTSSRHVKAISDAVTEKAKHSGFQVQGVEGKLQSEWVLADLGDVVVHVMRSEIRDFYQLEKLWSDPDSNS